MDVLIIREDSPIIHMCWLLWALMLSTPYADEEETTFSSKECSVSGVKIMFRGSSSRGGLPDPSQLVGAYAMYTYDPH